MSATAATLSLEEYEERKRALEEIKFLSKVEQEEVFVILKLTSSEYSENSNGIFFDLCKLPADAFTQIQKYLDFCRKNRDEFAAREEQERKAQEALTQDGASKDIDVIYS